MYFSKFVFVVLSILLSTSIFWIRMTGGRTIRLYTLNVITDPEYLHVTYNLHNDKVNANLTILRGVVQNIQFNVDVHKKIMGKYRSMGRLQNLNFCNILKNTSKDQFLRFMFEDFRSLNMTCPLRKKTYYLKDYTFHVESLPSLTPIGEYKYYVSFVKVTEQKSTVLLQFSIDGEIEK